MIKKRSIFSAIGICVIANISIAEATSQNPVPSWGLDRIDQESKILNNTYSFDDNSRGQNVNVYVIDTGLNAKHSEFVGRVGNVHNVVSDSSDDCDGHGTHVAGTIGGASFGVAKKVIIHPVRINGCNGFITTVSGDILAKGVNVAVDNAIKPAVINMSVTARGDHAALNAAIERATQSGITVVVAAGNQSGDACNTSPANSASAITVASSNKNDVFADHSNRGRCVDIIAPGEDITSAHRGSASASKTLTGTSMAAPHVTGAVARYLSINPNASPSEVKNALLANAVQGKITGVPAGTPNKLLNTSFIDGGNGGVTSNSPPTFDQVSTPKTYKQGQEVNFLVTASDPDGDNLWFRAKELPDGLTMSTSGRIQGVLSESGSFHSVLVVEDGNYKVTKRVHWIINKKPVFIKYKKYLIPVSSK